ncbi:hypothetical protein M422DRAFT_57013 [Sphaerobolus stellatus SS14]|uniref:Unplaced genomic scaffold SPHSTscaffold_792, whole genome shotgun sequence n=1 Tax=Sphaerobolus stellatus (strain SS14) TaxID=990650 RepID=A0A0C9U1R4_SPHS4|nr:hypothetical protein M422DRAFT_57013 [Sphaerobolus stellatus SS14]
MNDIFEIILESATSLPRGDEFFQSLRPCATRGEHLFRSATPFVLDYEWRAYQQQIQDLGELRPVSKSWDEAILPVCLRTTWLTHPSQTYRFLESWRGHAEIALVRHVRFDWGIPLLERSWVVPYVPPKFEGWWHRELGCKEYVCVPSNYDIQDNIVHEPLKMCYSFLSLCPDLVSVDTGYTGRGLSRTIIQPPSFYSSLTLTRGKLVHLLTLRVIVAPADAAFVAALKIIAPTLEELVIDFMGRQVPNYPPIDSSPIPLPNLKYLAVAGTYHAPPIAIIWPGQHHDSNTLPYLGTLSGSLTHLYFQEQFEPEPVSLIHEDLPLLKHLEFDWSDEFPALPGHLNADIIRIHAQKPHTSSLKRFTEQLTFISQNRKLWPKLRTIQDCSVSGRYAVHGLWARWDALLATKLDDVGIRVVDRDGYSVLGFCDRFMMESSAVGDGNFGYLRYYPEESLLQCQT